MEITIDTLINIATLLLGSSGGAFFTWKWIRRKSQAEASQAENEALKGKQDYYQQMMDDIAKDRDYYKKERDCMRDTIKSYDTRIDDLERRVARNGRMVESLRPFICTNLDCKLRHRATISAAGEIDTTEEQQQTNEDNDESK
jgi:hypothetical protein